MIALLADENLDARIVRGLLRRAHELDLVAVTQSRALHYADIRFGAAQLAGEADATILAWAADNGRAVVTHDVNTMIAAALDRVERGRPMPGLIAVPQQLGIGTAISDLALIALCAEPRELEGQVWYLPL